MKITVALDSGAHSLYHKYSVNKAGWRDKVTSRGTKTNFKGPIWRLGEDHTSSKKVLSRNYDFYASAEFDAYLETYVDFVKANQTKLDFYVTIDAIFNPQLSLDIFKLLLSKGIKPLPVLHPGEEYHWLDGYLKHTDYVGFGGVGQEWVRQHYKEWVEGAFAYLHKRNPQAKVHGFAMSSYKLLHDYSWFSVDSTTPFYMARCGTLLVPKHRRTNGKIVFDYLLPHVHMAITEGREGSASHSDTLNPRDKNAAREYLETFGYTLEEAQESAYVRGVVNYGRMYGLQTAVNEKLGREFRYYMSGASHESWKIFLGRCEKMGMSNIHFLGTHFAPKSLIDLMAIVNKRKRPTL